MSISCFSQAQTTMWHFYSTRRGNRGCACCYFKLLHTVSFSLSPSDDVQMLAVGTYTQSTHTVTVSATLGGPLKERLLNKAKKEQYKLSPLLFWVSLHPSSNQPEKRFSLSVSLIFLLLIQGHQFVVKSLPHVHCAIGWTENGNWFTESLGLDVVFYSTH